MFQILIVLGVIIFVGLIVTILEKFSKRYDTSEPQCEVYSEKEIYISVKQKQAYLSSPKWHRKRNLVLERDNWRCINCESDEQLECHHISYLNYEHEELYELITLCRNCHGALHKIAGYNHNDKFPASILKQHKG